MSSVLSSSTTKISVMSTGIIEDSIIVAAQGGDKELVLLAFIQS